MNASVQPRRGALQPRVDALGYGDTRKSEMALCDALTAQSGDDVRTGMRLAIERGMRFQLSRERPGLVSVYCPVCGWPETHREIGLARWLKHPHQCHPCAWERLHGTPCEGFKRP